MHIDVLGCHGGSSTHHRLTTFLIDGRLALDAGALSSGLTLERQDDVRVVLITHSHADHIGGLASLVELRSHRGGPPLVVAGSRETIAALRAHYFNGVIWPDFTSIGPPDRPTLELRTLEMEAAIDILGYQVRPIPVDHTVPTCGFLVGDGRTTVAYTGDTGPTERFWDVLQEVDDLGAVITEVSFPNRLRDLAQMSRHHVPSTLDAELAKLRRHAGVPVFVYHLKPGFDAEIRAELDAMVVRPVRILSTDERLSI